VGKALRGAAVVQLPQASNNADHGLLLLARRVKPFQGVHQILNSAIAFLLKKPEFASALRACFFLANS